MHTRLKLLAAAASLALLAGACTSTVDPAMETTTVEVTLREMTITPAEISAPAGAPLAIAVTNAGAAPHSFAVRVNGTVHETGVLDAAASETLELPALEPGTYDTWCTVPGHEDAGMHGSLVTGEEHATAQHAPDEGMSAEEMAASHRAGVEAFPATTEDAGNQVLEPTTDGDVKVFSLIAEETEWEYAPGKTERALTLNGTVPGPMLRARRGDRVRVVVDNRMPQPTALHFHGITLPNEMDGVPYITQDPIMPGTHFVYEFDVVDEPGTYMYHSHFNATEQVNRGFYGAFVIEPRRPAWDVEHMVFLSDGALGYTINGKGFPATTPLAAARGETVLLRLANIGQQLHPMHLHGYHFEVARRDGFEIPSPYTADTLVVAPGERFDVLFRADHPGVWAFHCHILPHVEDEHGMYGMVTALIVE